MQTLSGERVSKELLKLLAADDPRPAVRLMAASGVLSALLPEAQGLKRFDTLVEIETDLLFEDDAELRLATLLPNDRAAVTTAAQQLLLSNALRDRLLAACSDELRLTSFMSPREMRRAIYRISAKAFKGPCQAGVGGVGSHGDLRAMADALHLCRRLDPPAVPARRD